LTSTCWVPCIAGCRGGAVCLAVAAGSATCRGPVLRAPRVPQPAHACPGVGRILFAAGCNSVRGVGPRACHADRVLKAPAAGSWPFRTRRRCRRSPWPSPAAAGRPTAFSLLTPLPPRRLLMLLVAVCACGLSACACACPGCLRRGASRLAFTYCRLASPFAKKKRTPGAFKGTPGSF